MQLIPLNGLKLERMCLLSALLLEDNFAFIRVIGYQNNVILVVVEGSDHVVFGGVGGGP